MTRLLHLSDLHFGADRPELLEPLVRFVNGAGADLVIISGDLTQRARVGQFEAARAFLDRLEAPWLAVPGNHDTPLDNLFLRLFRSFSRFKRIISPELEPMAETDRATVVGLNTVNPHRWQSGKLRQSALSRIQPALTEAQEAGRLGVVVMHHPPEHHPEDRKRPMKGAFKGMGVLERMGADLVLCGHLHVWRALPVRAAPGLLMLQAGTGLSTRIRGEPNDLNVIDIGQEQVRVTRYGAGHGTIDFETISATDFVKESGIWRVAPTD